MKKSKEELRWDREIMEKCPILYQMRDASMTETCMCWGFECGKGWKEPLWKASCALEALNMQFWPRYKLRIQASQLKEKYGTLHFHYDVVKDSTWYKRILHDFFYALNKKLRQIDYKCKTVQDEEPYVEHKTEELKTKEAYVREKHYAERISNVTVEEKDGKWLKHTELEHYGKWHTEPTKHKLLYKLMDIMRRFSSRFSSYGEDWTKEQEVIGKYMRDRADEIIRNAETKCYDLCEECSAGIGKNGWKKRCETSDWTSYICEDCAKKHGGGYYMDGAYYEDGKLMKSKEELDKENAEIEAKWKAKEASYDAEEEAFKKELETAKEEDRKAGRNSEDESKK